MSDKEKEMEEQLELLRQISEKHTYRIYAMSNGSEIRRANSMTRVRYLEHYGFWICSIFECGVRVEA